MDSVRQQLEAFRFPSPTPTIRSHKIWSGQHLEPYLPSPKTSSPSPSTSSFSYFDSHFIDSAYASPSLEAPLSSNIGMEGMTLQDTLSELATIVRKYEDDQCQPMACEDDNEPKSYWEDDSDEEEEEDEDDDYDFVDEAYDSGCFTEDDESFETRLASLQPPSKRPRLSEEPEDANNNANSNSSDSSSAAAIATAAGVTIVKPSGSLRLAKRIRIKRRTSIPRSTPAGVNSSNGTNYSTSIQNWWSPRKPSPAFIDMFQF
ncbi:hypothetical protein ABW19_dt0202464 [Dactylella cylindrospora]|nr:hypothetical protein ABW19_dt0202464 [Dactylella cylindrospora]